MKLSKIALLENFELAKAINKAIDKINPDMSYADFAVAVANVIKNDYGSHLAPKFLDRLTQLLQTSDSEPELFEADDESDFSWIKGINFLYTRWGRFYSAHLYDQPVTSNINSKKKVDHSEAEKILKYFGIDSELPIQIQYHRQLTTSLGKICDQLKDLDIVCDYDTIEHS